jgi:hypothetical protein
MKEIFSAFGSEIFRPLATTVIPGAMTITVWFIVLIQRFALLRDLVSANHTETAVLLALISIASGLLVEDCGSRIESRWFDRRLEKNPKFSTHEEEWNQYLRLAFKIEPVGQRYLRTIFMRFKFELGTAVALLSSAVGLFFTNLTRCHAIFWSAVCLVVAGYVLIIEAHSSHRLLSEVRHEILKGAITYPSD